MSSSASSVVEDLVVVAVGVDAAPGEPALRRGARGADLRRELGGGERVAEALAENTQAEAAGRGLSPSVRKASSFVGTVTTVSFVEVALVGDLDEDGRLAVALEHEDVLALARARSACR